MNLKEQIRKILREENFIPLEDLTTVIKDYEGGFDVFIMNKDEKVGEISFAKESLPNLYTIVDASIDDEYKGNRIYPKTIINLFKERPNIIINSVFRSPEAEKSWRHLLNNLPSNIGKSVKYHKEEDTTLYQLKLKNLQEQISKIQEIMKPKNPKGWNGGEKKLEKEFSFEDFATAMDFVNKVAKISEKQNHHPDIEIKYNKVYLSITDHEKGKVSEKCIKLIRDIEKL